MPIVVIGGVTAAGKTTTAKRLKEIHNWEYVEADEYHSKSSIEKMQAGIALTDDDRLPWLQRLHEQLEKYSSMNQSCVITCSALKKIYRQILLTGSIDSDIKAQIPTEDFYLIMLTLSKDDLHERLIQRQKVHFMNPALLESQLATLELPINRQDEPRTYVINCDNLSVDDIVQKINEIIQQ